MSTTTGGKRSAYVPELDGVRGIAIAGVMALHFIGALTPTNVVERIGVKLSSYGVWGVDLFFVLSGFLITGILLQAKGSKGYFKNFYVRRVLRIFPLYYGVLVLLVLIPVSVLKWMDPDLLELRRLQPWIWTYLTNFYLGGQTSFSIPYLSHFWSLAVEEHFYFVWPVLILWLSRRSAMRLCVGLSVFALGARIWFSVTTPDLLHASVLTPCRLDSLCIGGWFALTAQSDDAMPIERAMRWLALSAAVVLALSTWHVASTRLDAVVLPLRTSLLAVFFGLFIYVASRPSGWPIVQAGLRAQWLRSLGKYSYGLYVYHGLVSYAMHRYSPATFLNDLVGVHILASALQVAFGVGLSLGISVISYELIEARFLALKSYFDYTGSGSVSTYRKDSSEPRTAVLLT